MSNSESTEKCVPSKFVEKNGMSYTILETIKHGNPVRIPVWVMRQAGRYLPEFRKIREEHKFFTIVNNPHLAAEVTMMPIRRYDLDAAIIFSDILVVPQALGMEVEMSPGLGPVFPRPLVEPADIKELNFDYDPKEAMKGTLGAITETRQLLSNENRNVALIGFSGAPWTLMAYMIEGSTGKTWSKAKSWLYRYPEESASLLEKLSTAVVAYLVQQVTSGAQLLQVFESHAECLSPELFTKFVLPTLTNILKRVKKSLEDSGVDPVPMIIFAKGGHYALKEIAGIGYDVVGLDWTIDPKVARELVGPDVVLQGNLDPCALYAPQETLEKAVDQMVSRFGTKNYICNLGHGIYPDVNPEAVKWLVEKVHTFKL